MGTFVLVHGAWHTGEHFEAVAAPIREAGHTVHLPTLAGNRPDDSRVTSLENAIQSLLDYFDQHELTDVVLMGHSYGGMVITGAADRLGAARIRRLVYWNAFVPRNGDCLNDLVPPHYVDLFQQIQQPDGGVMLPWPIWREAFINDADEALARQAYDSLNPHPYNTFADQIVLQADPAEFKMGKSYINCVQDTALPHSLGWHPRLSERLGLFRYVAASGSHEMCFTDPVGLAQAILKAGAD